MSREELLERGRGSGNIVPAIVALKLKEITEPITLPYRLPGSFGTWAMPPKATKGSGPWGGAGSDR
ncbi:MAG: hypothetical protein QXJ59_11030 [Thermofilaceae archaeon]